MNFGISSERASWLAPYQAERAAFLCSLLGLEDGEITQPVQTLSEERTVRDVLAHMAAWESRVASQIETFLLSDEPPFPPVSVDVFNANALEERADHTIPEIIDELGNSRLDIMRILTETDDEAIDRIRTMPGGQKTTMRQWAIETYIDHDRGHREEIEAWAGDVELDDTSLGHGTIAAAALDATFREVMVTAQLARQAVGRGAVTPEGWTATDFIGHLADWDRFTLEPLRQVAAGQPVRYRSRPVDEFEDRLNAHMREKRQGQTWEEVEAELKKRRGEIVTIMRGLSEERLAKRILCPWPEEGTVYYMVTDLAQHDREHAALFRRVYQSRHDARGETVTPDGDLH